MFLPKNKFLVPSDTHPTNLHKFHLQKPMDNQNLRPASSCAGESLSRYHAGNTFEVIGDQRYSNSDLSKEYWNNQSMDDYLQIEGKIRSVESSNNFYYGDPLNQTGPVTNAQEIFYDSYEPAELTETRYNYPMKNQTNELQNNPQYADYMDPEIGYSVSQKSNFEQNITANTSNNLLRHLSTQSNDPGSQGRNETTKIRRNALYRNLNSLMAGKNLTDMPNSRSKFSNPKCLEESIKATQKTAERNTLAKLLKKSESANVPEVETPNAKSSYSSIAQITQKISSKLKAEQIKMGEKKRMKQFWNNQHDAQLQAFAKLYKNDWQAIAQEFDDPAITPEGVKERYESRFSRQISRARFSFQEDQTIVQHYLALGSNWKKITTHLPGRTETMVRNRYYSSIKKKPIETFLNNVSDAGLPNVSSQTSEDKRCDPYSAENSSAIDNESEKYTGKHSEPEINSGSTAASVLLKKKISSISKNGRGLVNKKSLVSGIEQSQVARAATMTQKGNLTHQSESNYEGNQEKGKELKERTFRVPEIANDEFLNLEYEVGVDQKTIQRDEFSLGFQLGDENAQNKQQGFFDPFGFDDFDLSKREPHDLIGFDKISFSNEKMDCLDGGNASQNPIAEDNVCENLLNFKEDNSYKQREHPLTPLDVSPLFNPLKNKNFSSQMDEEFQSIFLSPNMQQSTDQQVQNTKMRLQPTAKLNQIESLMLQIKSIEKLFDRTKQEINSLQNRFTPK